LDGIYIIYIYNIGYIRVSMVVIAESLTWPGVDTGGGYLNFCGTQVF
jgi:hypothetical protein